MISMKNNKIIASWNKIEPSDSANERMLSAILERNRSVHNRKVEVNTMPRTHTSVKKKNPWIKWVAAAACISLMFATAAFASEIIRYNAAVEYLTFLGIPVEDLSNYSRKEIKDAERIISAEETLADGERNSLVDEYYSSQSVNGESVDVPTKVTSEQIRELLPTMTREEVLAFLGDTQDIGSGIYIYVYEVDQQYLLNIPFASDDAQLGVNGTDLLKTLKPIED
ncbi:MAG: hypothetical protein PWP10_4476 [Clostridiales bacterium]|jgi:hypothetical protein|nr:hypothetical protein [Clostridiales bacterium]